MKCFYHRSVDSIGSCRACGRGVCSDCITEYPEGLACKGRCEAAAEETISLIRRNRQAVAKAGPARYLFPVLFLVMGALMLFDGLGSQNGSINVLSGLGVLFIVGGIVHFATVRRVFRA